MAAFNVCRLCLAKDNLVWVFDDRFETKDHMKDVILVTTGIEVHKKDVISQKICRKCLNVAIKMFQFRKMSLKNDKYLKSQLQAVLKDNDIKIPHTDVTIKTEKTDMTDKKESDTANTVCYKVHPTMYSLSKQYPKTHFPSICIKSHVSPIVSMEMDAVENYFKARNLKMQDYVRLALRLDKPQVNNVEETATCSSNTLTDTSNATTNHFALDLQVNAAGNTEQSNSRVPPINIIKNQSKGYTIIRNSVDENNKEDNQREHEKMMRKRRRRLSDDDLSETEPKKIVLDTEVTSLTDFQPVLLCDICSDVFENVKDLKKHQNWHLSCQFCKTNFTTVSDKDSHENSACHHKKAIGNLPDIEVSKIEHNSLIRRIYPEAFSQFPPLPGSAAEVSKNYVIDVIEILSDSEDKPSTECSSTNKKQSDISNVAVIKPDVIISDNTLLDKIGKQPSDVHQLKELLLHQKTATNCDKMVQTELPQNNSIIVDEHALIVELTGLKPLVNHYKIPVYVTEFGPLKASYNYQPVKKEPKKLYYWNDLKPIDVKTKTLKKSSLVGPENVPNIVNRTSLVPVPAIIDVCSVSHDYISNKCISNNSNVIISSENSLTTKSAKFGQTNKNSKASTKTYKSKLNSTITANPKLPIVVENCTNNSTAGSSRSKISTNNNKNDDSTSSKSTSCETKLAFSKKVNNITATNALCSLATKYLTLNSLLESSEAPNYVYSGVPRQINNHISSDATSSYTTIAAVNSGLVESCSDGTVSQSSIHIPSNTSSTNEQNRNTSYQPPPIHSNVCIPKISPINKPSISPQILSNVLIPRKSPNDNITSMPSQVHANVLIPRTSPNNVYPMPSQIHSNILVPRISPNNNVPSMPSQVHSNILVPRTSPNNIPSMPSQVHSNILVPRTSPNNIPSMPSQVRSNVLIPRTSPNNNVSFMPSQVHSNVLGPRLSPNNNLASMSSQVHSNVLVPRTFPSNNIRSMPSQVHSNMRTPRTYPYNKPSMPPQLNSNVSSSSDIPRSDHSSFVSVITQPNTVNSSLNSNLTTSPNNAYYNSSSISVDNSSFTAAQHFLPFNTTISPIDTLISVSSHNNTSTNFSSFYTPFIQHDPNFNGCYDNFQQQQQQHKQRYVHKNGRLYGHTTHIPPSSNTKGWFPPLSSNLVVSNVNTMAVRNVPATSNKVWFPPSSGYGITIDDTYVNNTTTPDVNCHGSRYADSNMPNSTISHNGQSFRPPPPPFDEALLQMANDKRSNFSSVQNTIRVKNLCELR